MNKLNVLEEDVIRMLNTDPLAIAEELTGERDTPASSGLGFLLLQELAQQKRDALEVLGDTFFSMDYAYCLERVQAAGFRKIYSETHGENNDVYEIWWHDGDGLLLTTESYKSSKFGVNSVQCHYNWKPHDYRTRCRFTESGGFVPGNGEADWRTMDLSKAIWEGSCDGREGLMTHLKQLRLNGQFLPKWIKAPGFLWLLNYSEPKVEGYDYKAISMRKIATFPEEVQRAMGF